MTNRLEIDLDTERIHLDGAWLSRDELTHRIQASLAGGDYRISKLSDALEHLGQTVAGAKTLGLRLTGEQYAKLESAGNRVGKSPQAFARELLTQVLGTAVATSQANAAAVAAISSPSMPALSMTPPPQMTPVNAAGLSGGSPQVTAEEAASALTITPKRRGEVTPPPQIPPLSLASPTVVVDLSSAEADPSKRPAGAPGDARRWFNRS